MNRLSRSRLVRLDITAALLAFALSKLHTDEIAGVASARGMALLLVATIGLLIVVALNTVRWLLVARVLTLDIPWFRAVQWVLIGHFFNQILPSSVGGDVVRGLVAGRGTGDLPSSIVSIALDRLVGLHALLALIVAGQHLVVRFDDSRLYEAALAAVVLGLCALVAVFVLHWIFGSHFPAHIQRAALRFSRDARELFARPALSIPALCVSFAMQGINLSLIAFIADQLGANVTLSDAFLVIPTVLLVASLSISLGGWGARETGFALGFTLIDQSSSIAVATSIIIGLANLISALPGIGAWGLLPRTDRPVNALGRLARACLTRNRRIFWKVQLDSHSLRSKSLMAEKVVYVTGITGHSATSPQRRTIRDRASTLVVSTMAASTTPRVCSARSISPTGIGLSAAILMRIAIRNTLGDFARAMQIAAAAGLCPGARRAGTREFVELVFCGVVRSEHEFREGRFDKTVIERTCPESGGVSKSPGAVG